MDYSLPRKDIIRSNKDIQALLNEGESVFRYPLKACYRRVPGTGGPRMMVSVPKRLFKRAVWRNRLKRLVREAFRLNRNMLEGAEYDFLFVYLGKEMKDYGTVESSLREILKSVVERAAQGGELPPDTAR